MRADPADYRRLPLRASSLLADVPLHDVWTVDLHGGAGRTVLDVHRVLEAADPGPVARALFGFRGWLGRVFGWDREASADLPAASFVHRIPEAERAASLVTPGTPMGPFRLLLANPLESIAEVRNGTVHAFSVMALEERAGGYRLWWGIHVLPVGWITRPYLWMIEPFRRFLIYPAVLRRIRRDWA